MFGWSIVAYTAVVTMSSLFNIMPIICTEKTSSKGVRSVKFAEKYNFLCGGIERKLINGFKLKNGCARIVKVRYFH